MGIMWHGAKEDRKVIRVEVRRKVYLMGRRKRIGNKIGESKIMEEKMKKYGYARVSSSEQNEDIVKVGYLSQLLDEDTGELVGPYIQIPITAGVGFGTEQYDQDIEAFENSMCEKYNLNNYRDSFMYEGHRVHLGSWSPIPLWMKAMKPGTTNIVIPAYPVGDSGKTIELTIPVKAVGEENAQPENNQPENTTADTSKKDEPSSTAKSPKTGETSMAVVWGIVAIAGVMLVVCKKRETK